MLGYRYSIISLYYRLSADGELILFLFAWTRVILHSTCVVHSALLQKLCLVITGKHFLSCITVTPKFVYYILQTCVFDWKPCSLTVRFDHD